MVLSNKKLKHKLKAELTESLAASVANTDTNNDGTTANPDQNSHPQSLKQLLDSRTQRPRLSKRDKRRKTRPFPSSQEDKTASGSEGSEDEKKKKNKKGKKKKKKQRKRKRDEEEKYGILESGEHKVLKKAAKNEEEKEAVDLGNEEQRVTETNKNSDSPSNGYVTTKVYVGGIPYYSTEDDIRSYFEGCGTITEIDCMKFPESGKFRGIAIITFKTEAAAKRALALDGADMGGLFLKIQPYSKTTRSKKGSNFAPEIVDGYNRAYVGNLWWDITEDNLRKLFSDCKISSIRFGMDKETGEFRGYAHVDFSDRVSLAMALKLDQRVLCGRPVMIRCAVPKKGAVTHQGPGPEAGPGPLPAITEAASNVVTVTAGSGKMRRRTCYDCGEKGHISSDCPKKQTDGPTDPKPS
ncbi:hypothetical protein FNV43_RR24862 [Rhamnella rubrinervis]|uniref:Uncharacterized protein n=1 Tax=Rhamnella rubrinervis TaxID=2594499 RepID=A0A8K0DTE2_9ROSA|nr:hypothetical protein FNV43_RR24862 [Rhamnella rubrinervis]